MPVFFDVMIAGSMVLAAVIDQKVDHLNDQRGKAGND
jgi:hypothetical protein